MKMNILARSQWPSSAAEYRRLSSSLLLRKATVIRPNIHFRFVSSLYVLATLTRGPDDALVCLYVPLCLLFHFCLFPASPGFPYYITQINIGVLSVLYDYVNNQQRFSLYM